MGEWVEVAKGLGPSTGLWASASWMLLFELRLECYYQALRAVEVVEQ